MEHVCKGELSGGKGFCQGVRQDGLEALPVCDNVVKCEIPAEGLGVGLTALGELQSLILLSVS